jgi:hypothetical protein
MADEQKSREITKEEQAVLDEGKAQLERAKMAIGQPLPAMHDPLWLLSEEGAPVLAHALGRNAKNEPVQPKTGTVTVTIPREFVFHATNFHRFVLRAGVRDIPESLLDVPYVVSKGVRVWERPKPQVQAILGSTTLGPTVKYLGHDTPSGNFITSAFETSKLSVEQWNALSDEERGTRAIDEVSRAEAAQAASKDQSEGRVPAPPKPETLPQPPAPQRPQMTPPEVKKAEAAMQPDRSKK